MFEDSLVESAGRIKTKTKYTTVVSLLLQFMLIGVMVLIPLIYTEALPSQTLHTLLVAPPPPPPPPPPAPAAPKVIKVVQTNIINGQLRAPVKVPTKIAMIKEDEAPPPVASTGGVQGGVQGGVAGGTMGGVIGGMIGSTTPPPPPQPKVAAPVQRIRVSSGVAAGNLINKINPIYPTMAKTARIQGSVILQATISKSGAIENVHSVSGHPMLVPAAIDAVRQWRYRPYLLNGEPVEVETQITVNFTLGG